MKPKKMANGKYKFSVPITPNGIVLKIPEGFLIVRCDMILKPDMRKPVKRQNV